MVNFTSLALDPGSPLVLLLVGTIPLLDEAAWILGFQDA
jgi:hypothetical protein